MPPDLDIYIVSKSRDQETLERFIKTYVDRQANESRDDEELMMLPLDAMEIPDRLDQWDWEPAFTLSHILKRGLDYPRRAFVVYLKPKDRAFDRVILAFTADDHVVFGLSVDDEDEKKENLDLAKSILHILVDSFNGHLGMIVSEEAPPLWATKAQDVHGQIYIWKKN